MASADARTRTAPLLLAFSAAAATALFLLLLLLVARAAPLHPRAVADLLQVPALTQFVHGHRILDLATRRNMVLLCHAILILILREAGVLVAPARPRAYATPAHRHHHTRASTSVVVWRRPPVHDAAHRLVVDRHLQVQAAPALTTQADDDYRLVPVATKQKPIVVRVDENKPGWDDDYCPRPAAEDRDELRAAIVPLEIDERPAAANPAAAVDATSDDRRAVAVAGNHVATSAASAAREEETAGTMELADDRAFEEFIRSQRRKMRQESLRLLRRSCQQQAAAIATC